MCQEMTDGRVDSEVRAEERTAGRTGKWPVSCSSSSPHSSYRNITLRLPWWPRGQDSAIPLQGAQVRCPFGELRSRMPQGTAKTINKHCSKIILKTTHICFTQPSLSMIHITFKWTYMITYIYIQLNIHIYVMEQSPWILREKINAQECCTL